MKIANKVKLKYFLGFTFVFAFALVTVKTSGSRSSFVNYNEKQFQRNDTIIPGARPLSKRALEKLHRDSLLSKKKIDTTIRIVKEDSFTVKYSKDTLDGPIAYDAEDSMVYDVVHKKIRFYGKKTKTIYKDNELTAPIMELDQETGNITASIKRDSAGKLIALPTFKQGDFTSQMDSIKFNMKSGKGLTKSTYTQQGEMYVYGEAIKKVSPDVFFVKRGRITTCDLDTPHFAFVSNRFKFISKKLAITGPIHPEFEGVPIPIYLPFGIFPLNQGRHSGLLSPSFATSQQYGIGLENGGYYKILGNYWDMILQGSVYSYGGWKLRLNPHYNKRYHYNGSINFQVQNTVFNHKGDPDYMKDRSYNFQWYHQMDSKARPGVSFSANVNAGSSSFNRFITNNPRMNFENQLQSSISYQKTWKDKPFNLSVTANHNQNTNTKLINVNVPDVVFSVNTIYPFRPKDFSGTPKWFENIGIGYQGELKSQFSFYDTVPNIFKQIKDTFQYGAHHNIPISLALPAIGIFQVAPGVSYSETWYQRKLNESWNSGSQKLDTTVQTGFFTARDMSFNLNVSTAIFGMIASKSKTSRIVAIRHEIRPTIGLSYHPDLNSRNYIYTQVNTYGDKAFLPVFGGNTNIFPAYGYGKTGGISYGIDNNIQMKVRSKKDTGEAAVKKISILDGFSISGFYNFLADSFRFTPILLSAHSTLFDKVNITASGIIDPYRVNARGQRLNDLSIQHNPLSVGRFTSGNLSISSRFQGGDGKSEKKVDKTPYDRMPGGYTNDDYNSELAYIRNNPAEFADFKIPWSINFSYSLTYNKYYNFERLTTTLEQNVNFNGTLNLTPKWQMGASGSYNLSRKQLGYVAVSISREMHCWQMSIQLSPVGLNKFFSINISPKSGLLRDLKINRTRQFYD